MSQTHPDKQPNDLPPTPGAPEPMDRPDTTPQPEIPQPELPGGELGDNPVPEIAPDAPVEMPDIKRIEVDLPPMPRAFPVSDL